MIEATHITSALPAAPEDVWAHAVSVEGINEELAPWLRMTVPRALRDRSIAELRPGDRLGRSWLLLFGLLPCEVDVIGIAELRPGRRFRERSRMLTFPTWEHERTVRPTATGCTVTDLVRCSPHPIATTLRLTPLLVRLVAALFRHRHRRIAARFAA